MHFLLEPVRPFVPVPADVALDLVGRQQVDHRRRQVACASRQRELEVRALRVERRLNAAVRVEHAPARPAPPGSPRRPRGQWLLLAVHHAGQLGQSRQRHLAEGHAAVFLVLGLQRAGEVLVALVGHDVELVDRLVEDAQAVLVHRQAQAAADLLPLLHGAAGLVERADLEDVGVVPALAQRRVAEDEAQRLVQGEQALLVLHDQVVDLVVGLRVAARVLEHALLVLGEVAVVEPLDRLLEPVEIAGTARPWPTPPAPPRTPRRTCPSPAGPPRRSRGSWRRGR